MKRSLILWLIIITNYCSAQIFQTAFTSDRLHHAHTLFDTQGNIYLAGYQLYHPAWGDSNTIYKVIKHAPSGAELWKREFISPSQLWLYPVMINNNLYLAGNFSVSLCFSTSCTSSNGQFDNCFITIDPNGVTTIKVEGTSGAEQLNGLTAHNGNLYAVGSVSAQAKLGSNNTFYT